MKRIAVALCCVVALACAVAVAKPKKAAPTPPAEPKVTKGLKEGCGIPPAKYGPIPRGDCFYAEVGKQTVTICVYSWMMKDPAEGIIGCSMRLVQPNCGEKFVITPDSLLCVILEPGVIEGDPEVKL